MAAPDGRPAAPTPTGSGCFLRSGKVRDLYRLADGRIVLVASDRISAFDVVLPSLIPDKGRVLTGVSRYWFAQTGHIIANHLLSADPAELAAEADDAARTELRGRIMVCRPTTVLPIEAVVRGYLAGSGLREYRATGAICGVPLQSVFKLVFNARSGRVLGVHLMDGAAPEIIQTMALALRLGVKASHLKTTMPLHPTVAEELFG